MCLHLIYSRKIEQKRATVRKARVKGRFAGKLRINVGDEKLKMCLFWIDHGLLTGSPREKNR